MQRDAAALTAAERALLAAAGWEPAPDGDAWIDRGASGRRYPAWRALALAARDLAEAGGPRA